MNLYSMMRSERAIVKRSTAVKTLRTFIYLNLIIIGSFICSAGYQTVISNHLTVNYERIDQEVMKLIQEAKSRASYPNADKIDILLEQVHEIYEDGSAQQTVHVVYKILSENGKQHADCDIEYNILSEEMSLKYARTIHPRGIVFRLKKSALALGPSDIDLSNGDLCYQHLTFSMPKVDIKSVVDYKYVTNEKPSFGSTFSTSFSLQRNNPILLYRYKIIAPETMKINYLLVNPLKESDRSPTISREAGKKIYLWELKDIPPIRAEEYMPNLQDVAAGMMVTTVTSWEAFFSWWMDEVKGKIEPNVPIMQKVAELTKGLSNPDEKAEALFQYVVSEISYGNRKWEVDPLPASASEVFADKQGVCRDKSTLLISMLKAAGIPAYYVHLPTPHRASLVADIPYPYQFNHSIVAIKKADGYHYLDPTAGHRFDRLPGGDQNRDVIISKEDGPIFAKTPLADAKENARSTKHKVRINSDRSIHVEHESHWTGSQEAEQRHYLTDISPEEAKEQFEEYAHQISDEAKVLHYNYNDPLDRTSEFKTTITFDAHNYCEKDGNFLKFQVPILKGSCLATGEEERQYPIVYQSLNSSSDQIEFNIPEGYKIYHLPERVDLNNPYFSYSSNYQVQGSKILYQEEYIENAVQIPAEEYADYRAFCQKMDESRERPVIFSKENRRTEQIPFK